MNDFFAHKVVCAAAALLLLTGGSALAADNDLKLEAQLVSGTNDPQAKGTPVSPQIEKRLKHLPLKWEHYFVVNSQKFTLSKNESKELQLSDQCQISVASLGGEKVTLTLESNAEKVGKVTQRLKKGQVLVAGGNAGNSIVVLRQTD